MVLDAWITQKHYISLYILWLNEFSESAGGNFEHLLYWIWNTCSSLSAENWIHYHFCLVLSGINSEVLIESHWTYCVLCLIQYTWINMSRMWQWDLNSEHNYELWGLNILSSLSLLSYDNSLLYVLPISYQWEILHGWLLMCPWKCVDQQNLRNGIVLLPLCISCLLCVPELHMLWTRFVCGHTCAHTYFLENSHFHKLLSAYFILLSVSAFVVMQSGCSFLLGCCTMSLGDCCPVFLGHMMIPDSRGKSPDFFKGHLTSEDGTTMLTQNIWH
jgi:hypothetical protein